MLDLGSISHVLVVIFCFALDNMFTLFSLTSLVTFEMLYTLVFTSAEKCTTQLLFECTLIRDGRAVLLRYKHNFMMLTPRGVNYTLTDDLKLAISVNMDNITSWVEPSPALRLITMSSHATDLTVTEHMSPTDSMKTRLQGSVATQFRCGG